MVAPVMGRLRTPARVLLLAVLLAALLMTTSSTLSTSTARASGLSPLAAAQRYPILAFGSRGPAVRYLQGRLGLYQSGVFGMSTTQAVKLFERRHGWPADGRVGTGWWRALHVKHVTRPTKDQLRHKVLVVAAAQKGKPYRYGAAGPRAFDCSGYVGYVYRHAIGKKLPRTATAIRHASHLISRSSLRPGDLVFVRGRGGRSSHVAIYAGSGRWWEASRPGHPVAKNRAWTSRVQYGRII